MVRGENIPARPASDWFGVAQDLRRTSARSDYPVTGSACGYTGARASTAVSKHLLARMEVGGLRVAWLGAHLKAFPTVPSACAQREGQAEVLRLYEAIAGEPLEMD